jgi:hypothetical protein
LLDELEKNLLAELKEILEGKVADRESAERGKKMIDVINDARRETAEAKGKQVADSTGANI